MEPKLYGPYLLLQPLGSGGSGEAFLAKPTDESRNIPTPIVLKRLHPQLVDSENFVRRFLHEAEIAISIDSPHVAHVYDVGAAEGTFFMAMEYVHGWTLTELLMTLVKQGAMPPIPLATRLVSQALIGLAALHGARSDDGLKLEFVHRDLAPKNLMIGDDGVVRIIDLGLGKSNVQDWKTATGTMLGSVGYMAPEQIAGSNVDRRSDLFSLGVVLYEMLTVHRWITFGPVLEMVNEALEKKFSPPSLIRPEIAPALDEVVRRATAKDPAQRYPTAEHFIEALHVAQPPTTSIQEIRAFLGSVFGREIVTRKRAVDRLLDGATPAMPTEPEAVILSVRKGVSEAYLVVADQDHDTDEDMEPATAPERAGITDEDDPSEAATFGQDDEVTVSEAMKVDSSLARTSDDLPAIPPGDTVPTHRPPSQTDRDQQSPVAVAMTIRDLRKRAVTLRQEIEPRDPRRRRINEILAHLSFIDPERSGPPQLAKLKRLEHQLDEVLRDSAGPL